MLLGETGTGKSTFLKHFLLKHPQVQHQEFSEIPVLYVEVPAKCSIKKLASVILRAMGSPFWNRGDEVELTFQLAALLISCKVRLLILDEVNHLVDRGAAKTHYTVADWIKSLSSQGRTAIVLSGVPRAKTLLDTNEQLADRFREVIELPTLSVDGKREQETRAALTSFASLLEGVDSVDLTSSTMARLIVFATGGRLRQLRRILVRAVELAFECSPPRLDIGTLARAFVMVIFPSAPKGRNPFLADFVAVPLIKMGEPYCTVQSTAAEANHVAA